MESIQLAIIEDDPIIQESIEMFMGDHPQIEVAILADRVEDFLESPFVQQKKPLHILLLDIGLPGMSGIQGIYHIRQAYPDLDIIMLTTFEEDDKIFDALCAGACSYISKRTPLVKIREAVITVHRGGSYMSPTIARKIAERFMPKPKAPEQKLSERQMQIVEGLVDGLRYKMVADKLGISLDTVRDHIKRIYRTLEINSKAEIIKKALNGEL